MNRRRSSGGDGTSGCAVFYVCRSSFNYFLISQSQPTAPTSAVFVVGLLSGYDLHKTALVFMSIVVMNCQNKLVLYETCARRCFDVRPNIVQRVCAERLPLRVRAGVITTSRNLDRELQRYYWLTVMAQDSASVPLAGHVFVLVEVDDVNDNAPLSTEPIYFARYCSLLVLFCLRRLKAV